MKPSLHARRVQTNQIASEWKRSLGVVDRASDELVEYLDAELATIPACGCQPGLKFREIEQVYSFEKLTSKERSQLAHGVGVQRH